jgi:hypothetical protein
LNKFISKTFFFAVYAKIYLIIHILFWRYSVLFNWLRRQNLWLLWPYLIVIFHKFGSWLCGIANCHVAGTFLSRWHSLRWSKISRALCNRYDHYRVLLPLIHFK